MATSFFIENFIEEFTVPKFFQFIIPFIDKCKFQIIKRIRES